MDSFNLNLAFMEIIEGIQRHIDIMNRTEDNIVAGIEQYSDGKILVKYRGHLNEELKLVYWIDDNKCLHISDNIENADEKSEIFECAKDNGFSEEDIDYVKYGKREEMCTSGSIKCTESSMLQIKKCIVNALLEQRKDRTDCREAVSSTAPIINDYITFDDQKGITIFTNFN